LRELRPLGSHKAAKEAEGRRHRSRDPRHAASSSP
jgi:hypothetical protein